MSWPTILDIGKYLEGERMGCMTGERHEGRRVRGKNAGESDLVDEPMGAQASSSSLPAHVPPHIQSQRQPSSPPRDGGHRRIRPFFLSTSFVRCLEGRVNHASRHQPAITSRQSSTYGISEQWHRKASPRYGKT